MQPQPTPQHGYGPMPAYGRAGYPAPPPPPPPVAPNGQPPRVMKLRVVALDPSAGHAQPMDGSTQLARGMAVRRWLVDSLGAQFVPFLFFLDGLWQLWDQPYRQRLHDKFAGTTVVKVTP